MTRPPRIGFRREVAILLPATFLVLMVLSVFTLLSYRSAIQELLDDSRQRAAVTARRVALEVARHGPWEGPGAEARLAALEPDASSILLLDGDGRPLLRSGESPEETSIADLGALLPATTQAFGPDRRLGSRIVVVAPLGPPDERRYLRLDFPAGLVARQQRNLLVLTVLVVGVSGALAILTLFFLRHLLEPWDSLLQRARQAVPEARGRSDEIPFLLETFDRALSALTHTADETEDDIHILGRALTPGLKCGLLLLSSQGRVLALNRLGADLLGITEPEPGSSFRDVLRGHPELEHILADTLSGRKFAPRLELEIERLDQRVSLGMTIHELRRENRGVRGYLVLFADLTEVQNRAERERLSRNLAEMGELTAGIAHELRNSLASLRGYLSLAEKTDDESLGADLAEIRREADHLQRILDDFLSFARPGTVRMSRVSLEKIVRRAASDLQISGKGVEIRSVGMIQGTPIPRIWGDEQLLERALLNLLRNAADAERGAGHEDLALEVCLDYTGRSPEILVDDRGEGLSPEARDSLFVPFASEKPGGVGLGLALSRRILDLHGASLDLEDRTGGGTRARVSFPPSSLVTPDELPPKPPT